MYHLTQAVTGIKRAGFMSVACVIIMTCTLLIFGIFLLATANLREVLRFAHEKVEIVAFLEDDLSPAGADSLVAEDPLEEVAVDLEHVIDVSIVMTHRFSLLRYRG